MPEGQQECHFHEACTILNHVLLFVRGQIGPQSRKKCPYKNQTRCPADTKVNLS